MNHRLQVRLLDLIRRPNRINNNMGLSLPLLLLWLAAAATRVSAQCVSTADAGQGNCSAQGNLAAGGNGTCSACTARPGCFWRGHRNDGSCTAAPCPASASALPILPTQAVSTAPTTGMTARFAMDGSATPRMLRSSLRFQAAVSG